MDQKELKRLLNDVAAGRTDVDTAVMKLRLEPFEDLGFAKIDRHRGIRSGTDEVIYGEGKTPDQIVRIAERLHKDGRKTVIITRIYDVGVAGIHRFLAHAEDIMNARVIVAVAGMEGALASVIGGLADCPVIAVPTSVGYGASFGGLSALLSMLNSCASGVSVVNIDNGFGAGYLANMINHIGA